MPVWLASMTWLIAHDVWPRLAALDVPRLEVTEWLKTEGVASQYSIHGDSGELGKIWTKYRIDENSIQRSDVVWIKRLSPDGTAIPNELAPLRVIATSTFTVAGVLDEISVRVENRRTRVQLRGERFHNDFAFTFKRGMTEYPAFKVPLSEGGLISGALHPFSQLTDLRVGQRWRMQVFNPVAAMTGIGNRFMPLLVEVTGREPCITPDGLRECVIVEAPKARAWIDERGAMQMQETTLPLIGRIRVTRDGEFDDETRRRVQRGRYLFDGDSTL